MAKRTGRKSTAAATPPSLSVGQGLHLLRIQAETGERLLSKRPLSEDDHRAWKTATQEVLAQTYGSASESATGFKNAGMNFALGGGNETEWEQYRAERMRRQMAILRSLIGILESQVGPEWVAQNPPSPQDGSPEAVHFINCTFPGEFSMAKQSVTAGGNISVGGNFVVADIIRDSFNSLAQSQANPDVKDLVRQLGDAVVEMSRQLPPEQQKEVAQDLNTLATEAAKDKPIARYAKMAADGLAAVATTAGNVVVTGLLTALLKHWGIG